MTRRHLGWLVAGACVLSLARPAAASEAADSTVQFVGFSLHGNIAAWRQTLAHHHDGVTDRFRVARVVASETNTLLATYRLGSIQRRDRYGRRVRASATALAAANPIWAHAGPEADWLQVRRRAHFTYKRLPMAQGVLRLQPDDDVSLTAKADRRAIDLSSRGPMGYAAILRQFNGDLVNLGHFRQGAQGDRVTSHIQLFYSRTGYRVAIANSFDVGHGSTRRRITMSVVRTLPNYPIGYSEIGAVNFTEQNLRMAEQMFDHMHPGYGKLYNRFVGTFW